MKKLYLSSLVITLLFSCEIFAQMEPIFEPIPVHKHYTDIAFSEYSVKIGATSMGITAEVMTPLNSNFSLRAGINYFTYNSKYYENSINDPHGDLRLAFGYKPDLKMKGKLHMFHGHVLVDYYPIPEGLFFLSGGMYVGKNRVDLSGYLIDRNGDPAIPKDGEWPSLDFQGHEIKIVNGNVDAVVDIGNVIKPYFGFGLGRKISNKRIGFTFELGMMYQGDYVIKQNGIRVGDYNALNVDYEDDKAEKWLKRARWWPKIAFQLNYRIF
ncbi:putative exported transmembrane protein [Myroides injenensis]|uniref:putative exported transmembrane protein n=1 Tax=Myroides injenensis TaxID=1183151 RepID=UPI000287AA12|nr:putative exported transmembrane protein [Myroides injenensis]